jgi:HAD superfamily hydrolase (TIGR01509 family)
MSPIDSLNQPSGPREKPEAIVFDLGKVLVDFDYGIAARKLAQASKLPLSDIHQIITQPSILFRYETGHLTRQEFYRAICDATGFCGALEVFGEFFSDIFAPIPEMIELHARLRADGLPTFIFSNTNDLAIQHIRKNFPFFANFDDYIFSYEHGSMKPDAHLYEVVEKITGHEGRKILYLDDRQENIDAGQARNWQTVLQETPAKTRSALEKLGLV